MTTPAPLARRARITGIDATRGLALLGIMAVNALWAVDEDGNVTWTYEVAAGRSAATFAVLAGVSIAFMTGRRRAGGEDAPGVVAVLTTRAVLIGALGLALGYANPDVTVVILAYYAMLFVLAIPLPFLSTRALLITGIAVALVVPAASHLLRPSLHAPSGQNPSIDYLFHDPGGLLAELTVTGVYPALPWLAYICAGMAVGRLDLSSRKVTARLLVVGTGTAAAAAALSWLLLGPLGGREQLYATAATEGLHTQDVTELLVWGPAGTTPTTTWWWLATDAPHSSTPLDLLHTTGIAVALIGAIALLYQLGRAAAAVVLSPLAAAGSMTLTLYTGHVMFMNSPLDVFDATTGYLLQAITALTFALLWRRAWGRGPLEAVVMHASRAARRLLTPPPPTALPHTPPGRQSTPPR